MSTSTNKQSNNKKKIKVIVFIGPNTSGIVAHEKHKGTSNQYEGYSWDLFQKCMFSPSLDEKYTFDINYTDFGWTNYTQTIKDIHSGKYDIAISAFIATHEREMLINFTTPINIDANAIYHIDGKGSALSKLSSMGLDMFLYILISISIGIVIGLVLYYGNPKRRRFIRGSSKKSFFIRSIITGIAAMFGEMGFLSENASHTYMGVIIVVITMLTAYISLIIIQAHVTSALVEHRINKGISKYEFNSGIILGHEGYAIAKKIEDDGAKIHYIKGKTNDELLKFYIDNSDKYKGVALSYCDAYPQLTVYPELRASIGFGNEPSSWPVSSNKIDFLEDLNNTLMTLRKSRVMQTLCTKYFGDIPHIPTCSLR